MSLTFIEFQPLFGKLCRRFARKVSAEQAEVYLDCLLEFDRYRIEKAIEVLINESKNFPTPDEIKKVYYTVWRVQEEENKGECTYCEAGYIFFRINKRTFAHPCAHCQENSVTPHVARLGTLLSWAFKKTNVKTNEGWPLFRPDLNNMIPIKNAVLNEVEYKHRDQNPVDSN